MKHKKHILSFLQAVVNGNRDMAEYLLEKTDRAVLKTVDRDGRSALHYAAALSQVKPDLRI